MHQKKVKRQRKNFDKIATLIFLVIWV